MPISPVEAMKQRPKAAGAGLIAIITAALAGVYVNEGGYADHKADRGGRTMYGVTEAVARAEGYRGEMRYFPKHCTTPAMVCADRIYTDRYITAPGYMPMAAIEPAVLHELVDSAVLHGPPRPSGWFQETLNEACGAKLTVDRKVGARTISAYQACQRGYGKVAACIRVLDRLDGKQAAFFRAIVARNPSQRVFVNGWMRMRVGNVDRRLCGSGVA